MKLIENLSKFCGETDQLTILSTFLEKYLSLLAVRFVPTLFTNIADLTISIVTRLTQAEFMFNSLWTPFSHLFLSLTDSSQISTLLNVLRILSKKISGEKVFDLCHGLNALTEKRIDFEPDLDKRLIAYASATNALKNNLLPLSPSNSSSSPIAPLLFLFLRDLKSSEFTLRSRAIIACEAAFKAAALSATSDSGFHQFCDEILLSELLSQLKINCSVDVKMAHLRVIRCVVQNIDGKLSDLKVLLSNDEENDFFENVFHIQIYRRRREFARLLKAIENGARFSNFSATYVLMPLAVHFVCESTKDSNTKEEVIKTVGSLSRFINWAQMHKWINFFLKNLEESKALEKAFVRCVCEMIANFRFSSLYSPKIATSFSPSSDESTAAFFKRYLTAAFGESISLSENRKRSAVEIILRKLKSLLREKKNKEMVRVRVAVAIAQLLKHCPQEQFSLEVQSLLIEIGGSLKSRQQGVRDECRFALNGILRIVGVRYFPFILRVINRSLQSGYQRHIRAYTVQALLQSANEWLCEGDLDPYCKEVVKAVVESFFGAVAEEREVDKIKNATREAASSKPLNAFSILAQKVDFQRTFPVLVENVFALVFPKGEGKRLIEQKEKNKVDAVFLAFSRGLQINSSTEREIILEFMWSVLDNRKVICLKVKSALQKAVFQVPEREIKPFPIGNKHYDIEIHRSRFRKISLFDPSANGFDFDKFKSEVLTKFALHILTHITKKARKFDPILFLVLGEFSIALDDLLHIEISSEITLLILRSLQVLIAKANPHRTRVSAHSIASFCFQNLAKGGNVDRRQSCLAVLSLLMKGGSFVSLQKEQITLLLSFSEEHLNAPNTREQAIALSFIKTVVALKARHSKLYPLVHSVIKLSVSCGDVSLRKKCSKIVLSFLLNYPLSEKRLTDVLHSLLSGLEFRFAEGRLMAASLVEVLLRKAPDPIFNSFLDIIFFAVVKAFANDEDKRVQKILAKTLQSIFTRAQKERFNKLANLLLDWLRSDNSLLRCVALKAFPLSLRSHCLDSFAQTFFSLSLEQIVFLHSIDLPSSASNFLGDSEPFDFSSFTDSLSEPHWSETFLSLSAFSALFDFLFSSKDFSQGQAFDFLWLPLTFSALKLLSNSHFWVRSAALKLLLSILSVETFQKRFFVEEKSLDRPFCEALFEAVVEATKSRFFDLSFGRCANKMMLLLFEILKLLNCDDFEDFVKNKISLLFQIVRKMRFDFKRNFLDLLVSFLKRFDGELLVQKTLSVLMKSAYAFLDRQLAKDSENKKLFDEIQEKAQLFLKNLKEKVGEERYLETFNSLRITKTRKRMKRKRNDAIRKVVNPAEAATKKMKLNKRKKMRRKKKN